MKVYELLENVEIQSECVFCLFSEELGKRIVVPCSSVIEKTIGYIYIEHEKIYIEVENDID